MRNRPVVIEQPIEETKTEELVVEQISMESEKPNGGKWMENLFKRTKEWFEAEPDTDLK